LEVARNEGSRAGQQRDEGRQKVRGEKGETKEVTLAAAFSENEENASVRQTGFVARLAKCQMFRRDPVFFPPTPFCL